MFVDELNLFFTDFGRIFLATENIFSVSWELSLQKIFLFWLKGNTVLGIADIFLPYDRSLSITLNLNLELIMMKSFKKFLQIIALDILMIFVLLVSPMFYRITQNRVLFLYMSMLFYDIVCNRLEITNQSPKNKVKTKSKS